MITLFLNDKPAIINENKNIKFIRENSYFSKTGSYTYNIELPANIPENIAIFGHLYRNDISKKDNITYTARLIVDNILILSGTATITNITDTNIKIQLMGGNSELNFYNKNEKQYIDELPLGNWRGLMDRDPTMRLIADDIKEEFNYHLYWGVIESYNGICKKLWRENKKGNMVDWVALPCYNKNYDIICNNFGFRTYKSKKNGDDTTLSCVMVNDLDNVYLSAQPYLVPMIERIFKHLGYPVKENCLLDNEFFMHIVIVTANNRSDIARGLPHWTVSEFIEQIEKFFAVVITIDESLKRTYIKKRQDFFKSNTVYINDVLDEYSVTINEEETTDISNANIGYAEVPISYNRIDNTIKNLAKIDTTYNDETDLTNALEMLVQKLREEVAIGNILAYKGTIFKVCGHSYIIKIYDHIDAYGNTHPNHAHIRCIDEFANIINNKNKKDLDIELKICPAETTNDGSVPFYNEDGKIMYNYPCYMLAKADNTNPAGIMNETDTYLEDLISGETEVPEYKEDIMYICLYDGGFYKFIEDNKSYPSSLLAEVRGSAKSYPSGHVKDNWTEITFVGDDTDKTTCLYQKLAYESLALNADSVDRTIDSKVFKYKTLYSEVFKNLNKIDTQVEYCFKFFTDEILPVTSTFIIRNRKFACNKLEYIFNCKGKDKLVTGYFYELE